jgi:hypothetical protein
LRRCCQRSVNAPRSRSDFKPGPAAPAGALRDRIKARPARRSRG